MIDIFVSYARSDEHTDRIAAAAVRDRLTSIGLNVYMDSDLLAGDMFEEKLQKAISDAKLVVALWSEHSLTRTYVLGECDMAFQAGKLIPLLLEPAAREHIPLSLRKINHTEFDPKSQASWLSLIECLAKKLGTPELIRRFELSIRPLLATSTSAENLSVQVVLSDMKRSRVVIPDYQRDGGEWNEETKSIFIESIINNLAIPALFFEPTITPDNRQINEVVDGQQRLSALMEFHNNEFPLLPSDEAAYISPNSIYYAGKRFGELPPPFQDTFESYRLPIINLSNVGNMRLEIFRRINRGGTPLSSHDIRLAYYGESSPAVTFIKLAGIYDSSRASSASFLRNAKEKYNLLNPWQDPIARELWLEWWAGRNVTRGQAPSAMFLLSLMAAQFLKLGALVQNGQSLTELNIHDKKTLEDLMNIYCARTQFEDRQQTQLRSLFDITTMQNEFFSHFQYCFSRVQRGNKALPASEHKFLATVIGSLFGLKQKAQQMSGTEWGRIQDFLYAPKESAKKVGVVWRPVDGNWSGSSGWRGRLQATRTTFERLLL